MWLANDLARASSVPRPCLRTAADAAQMFGADFADQRLESLRIAHLEHDGSLICVSEQHGLHDSVDIATADLLREACLRHTRRIILAHNHPSGDPAPSASDCFATRRIAELLRLLNIELVDHLIFARGGISSFRALGLL